MKAIVTGITGLDGTYLTQLLLEKVDTLYVTYRRTRSVDFWRERCRMMVEADVHRNEKGFSF